MLRVTLCSCAGLVLAVLPACAAAPTPSPTPAPSPSASAAPVAVETSSRPEFESPGGMWLPSQLDLQAEQLRKLGLELDPKRLSDPTAYPLGAVISLGGCSASFISPDGLIATNHHCVTGALQYNTTTEHNLLKEGYLAKTRGDEKSNGPTARVYVTQSFRDVTREMREGLEQIQDHKKRHQTIEKRTKELLAKCEAKPDVRCDVASYFGGGQYLLIEKLEIKDVRLVYAPHEGIGNFGGEIDNWRWPRHGGDFSLLRAYVGKDGKPAAYSADNVPYKPRMHLKIATEPLRAGDLVFVAGYPGQTNRLRTAAETAEAIEWYYPKRIELFRDYLGLIERVGKDDADVRSKARPLERGLANALTYTQGSLEGLTKGGAAETRKKREAELKQWIAADTARQDRYGNVFPRLDKIFGERARAREIGFALDEVTRMSSLLRAAVLIARMAEERPKPDADREPDYQQRNWERWVQDQQALEKRYARKLDTALLELALSRIAKLPDAAARQAVLAPLLGKLAPTPENIHKTVERLYSQTGLEDTARRVKLVQTAKTAELRASKDPLIQAALALLPKIKEREDRDHAESGALELVRPLYVGALREMAPGPVAPDANGTLRVTYGTVRGYRPKPGAEPYTPFTRLAEVAGKATGKEPFDAPPRLVERAKVGKAGPYADPALGTLPVDFLADCDITGGNSGSATLDARGHFVGLAFDGNYEAMASDWLFMPEITRSIHVDARYMLWVMDAVDGADHLLREMGVTPALP